MQRGFSLIEVLVTVGIMVFLSGLVLTWSGRGRMQVALSIETAKVVQVLGKAKSFAIATRADPLQPCGYGVTVNRAPRTYVIFAYRAASCASITTIDAGDATKYKALETFPLSPAVVFGDGANLLNHVLFLPPDPQTFLFGVDGTLLSSGPGNIFLGTADQSATKRIQVNVAGQITL